MVGEVSEQGTGLCFNGARLVYACTGCPYPHIGSCQRSVTCKR